MIICIFQLSYSGDVAKRVSKWKLTDIKELQTYGKEFISGGPFADDRLEDVLRQTEVFEKFLYAQIKNRINYESPPKNFKFHDYAYMLSSSTVGFLKCRLNHGFLCVVS